MNKKVIIGLAVGSILSSVALANLEIAVSANYNAGNPGGYVNSGYIWMAQGSTIWARMSGVGQGGGAAYAVDADNGTMIAMVNIGGGPGQPYSGLDQENVTASPGATVMMDANISASSSGAYGTASVEASY